MEKNMSSGQVEVAERPQQDGGHSRQYALRTAGWTGLVGAWSNCTFLLGRLSGSRLDPTRSFISELSVPHQPGAYWYRLTDLVAGLLIIVLAIGCAAWLNHPSAQVRRPARAGCVMTALIGALSIIDAARPMPCSPTLDPRCARQEDSLGVLGQLTDLHTMAGVASTLAAVAAMTLLGIAFAHRADPRQHDTALARLSIVCATAMALAAGSITIACANKLPWQGAIERGQLLVQSLWLTTLGISLINTVALGGAPTTGHRQGRRDRARGGNDRLVEHSPLRFRRSAPGGAAEPERVGRSS
jgi:hypothetical protein